MVEVINFNKVIPNVFVDLPPEGGSTEVWGRNLTFSKGSSYLIEAASGRGKSSFCAFMYGLRNDYQGVIAMYDSCGRIVESNMRNRIGIRKYGIALMFQEHRIFPELTAVENIMLKNQLTDYFTEREIRIKLSELGLENRADVLCAKLSLGQQQRVAFIRMLAQPADFFLLDEPVSHLDTDNASRMGKMLLARQAADKCGVIITSTGNRLPYSYDRIIKL